MPSSDTQFKEGESGNPEGRPKEDPTIRQKAMAKGESIIDFWDSVMNNTKEKTVNRLRASVFLWEAGQGKNPIALSVDLEPKQKEKPIVIEHWYTKEELAKRAIECGLTPPRECGIEEAS